MLRKVEEDEMSHIVSWQPHGLAFKVHLKEQFVNEVLPLWFRHASYNSFQRQLNIYGFRRFPKGRDKDAYYHQDFVQGQYDRTFRILRNAIKGTNVRQPSDHSSFPDFYNHPIHDDGSGETRIPVSNSDRVTAAASNSFPVESSNSPRASIPDAFIFPTNVLTANSNVQSNVNSFPRYLASNHRSPAVGQNQSAYRLQVNPASNTINELLLSTPQWAAVMRSDQGLSSAINPLILELMVLQGQVNPSRPSSIVEQVVHAQALMDSLRRHNDYQVPPLAPPRMSMNNPYNSHPSMPPIYDSNEVLDLVLGQFREARGAGL